jgi:hypothetical protein
MVEGLENHDIPHTFIKSEIWGDKNKDLNKVEAVEIGFVTRLHMLY